MSEYLQVTRGQLNKFINAYLEEHLNLADGFLSNHVLLDFAVKYSWESDEEWERICIYIEYDESEDVWIWEWDWDEGQEDIRIYGIMDLSQVTVPNNAQEFKKYIESE